MNDPLGLLPFAMTAGGGSINGTPADQPVAAGVALLQRCAPLVRALAGRRAAILLPPGPAYLTALVAAEGRGAVLIDPLAAAPEVAYQLADAGVGAVLTLEAFAPLLPEGILRVQLDDAPRTATVVHEGGARVVDLGSHFGFALEGEQDVPGRDEEAVVVYTSAMAGVPLGAILTHRNLLASARATVEAARLTPQDRVLAPLPWSHLFGLVATGAAPLLAGASVVAPERFSPAPTLELLEGDGVTVMAGVPAIYRALLSTLERRDTPFSAPALRLCICGGAPLDPGLQERWAHVTGMELRQGYGLTEAGPACLFNRPDAPNHRGTLGTPFPGVEVTIRDPETGAPCADGEEGEICVRGEAVSSGYVGGPAAAAAGLARRDGWLRTGDLGVRRPDGFVAFRGVIKRMFTRDGYNVYPAELERVVSQLAGVRSVAAIGVPAADRENDIRLEIVGEVAEADVRDWCRRQLSAYKQPAEVVIRPR